jgi:SAM-dependent methyltransferase
MPDIMHGVTGSATVAALYSNYYVSGEIEEKRRITAVDSLQHITGMLGDQLGKVIDVGAGNGALLEEMARAGVASSLSGLEISASGLERIRSRARLHLDALQQFDGYTIPFGDNEFDTALSVHVVEHVEHERLLLKEMGRIARRLYIEVPLEGGLRGRINRKFGHINYYVPKTFLNLVETSGLRVTGWRVLTHSTTYERHIYGNLNGSAKSAFRRGFLAAMGPTLAPEFMTYLFGVTAEKA